MIERGRQQAGHAPSMLPMNSRFEMSFAVGTVAIIANAAGVSTARA